MIGWEVIGQSQMKLLFMGFHTNIYEINSVMSILYSNSPHFDQWVSVHFIRTWLKQGKVEKKNI